MMTVIAMMVMVIILMVMVKAQQHWKQGLLEAGGCVCVCGGEAE